MIEYVEQRQGEYYAAGTRVPLGCIVAGYCEGQSPETIRQNFPSLSLEQVYGAVAYYLAHRQEIDEHLSATEQLVEDQRNRQELPPGMRERLAKARDEMHTPST